MFQRIFILFTALFLQLSFAVPSFSPSEKSILFQNERHETVGFFNSHENTLYIWTELSRPGLPWSKSKDVTGGPSYGFLPILGPSAKYKFLPGETFKSGLINKEGSLLILTEYFDPRLNRMQSLYILPQHPQFRGQRYLFSSRPQLPMRQCGQIFSTKSLYPKISR